MTLEDPFYVVKDEVFKALNKTRGLYLRWQEISKTPVIPNSPEAEWTSNELRNALRSIEWDLEDLDDAIKRNSSKFKIDNKELYDRKTFVEATRQEVKNMKGKMTSRNRDVDSSAREPLLGDESPVHFNNSWSTTPKYSKYSKLSNRPDSPQSKRKFGSDLLSMQEKLLDDQNDQLEVISHSVGSLKAVSKQIGMELDEQSVMLDDLHIDLENADSKLENTVKKVAKVLHINNDRRQWMAIGILLSIMFLLLLLFIML